jgi:flagellar basal-body rod protein FlgB
MPTPPAIGRATWTFQGEFPGALGLTPEVVQVTGLPVKNDGNNVSLDGESRLLAENALRFQVPPA